ncbi:FAD/NAD(P)-binding domain-containing protein [Hesseltinella vesiculosa]|uniref:FAD/NAD(P)-binding domain-containing protein n=1 Tax=Hesseltinella vesiculosa TaxID=101127 RepID=A0A1X2GNT2_9FUNG|nr:FAD/NAD(P)-binding domain-containing protein [Hesseltinella vesiculosa]
MSIMLNLSEPQKEVVKLIYDAIMPSLSQNERHALVKTYQDIHDTVFGHMSSTEDLAETDSDHGPDEKQSGLSLDDAKTKIDQFAKWGFLTSGLSIEKDVLPLLQVTIAESSQANVARALKLMSSSMGMCMFTMGKKSTSFLNMSMKERQSYILSWRKTNSMRMFYRAFTTTATFLCYSHIYNHSQHAADLIQILGLKHPLQDTRFLTAPPPKHHIHTVSIDQVEAWIEEKYSFDAIIVGSGVAAGPCVLELAKAGKTVLVIEKGSGDLQATAGVQNNYEQFHSGGFFTSKQGSITMSAASTLGGGSTVGFGACVKTPPYVLREWEQRTNKAFDAEDFEKDMEMLYQKMKATTDFKHSDANMRLIYGCTKLQRTVKELAHVQPQQDVSLGYGGINLEMWFLEAQQHGALFLCDTTVDQVFIRHDHAQGVMCTLSNGQQVTLHSQVVVMASGALQTPHLLKKSGLANKHIGQHLRTHPTVYVNGYFPNPLDANINDDSLSKPTLPVSASYHLNAEDDHGCRIETQPLGLGKFSSLMSWHGGLHHKQTMLGYKHGCTLLVRCRDRNSNGVVSTLPDSNAPPTYEYHLSDHDHKTLLSGIIESLNILTAAGARHLHCPQINVEPFVFKRYEEAYTKHPRYLDWLKSIYDAGVTSADGIYSMHQMSSCRMGYSIKNSAVQLTGETWEIKNLYVIDASVMPSACGCNPMLTIQTLSYGITKKILQRLELKRRL